MALLRPQCLCHAHVGAERGPCHIGAPGKCHDVPGQTVKRWYGGKIGLDGKDYTGLDIWRAAHCAPINV